MTWNFGGGCGPTMSHHRSPNINGNVRDCVFSSLVFFLFFFLCSGEKWEAGQRRIALMSKASRIYILCPSAMLGFRLLDRFAEIWLT